tara:strand:+ start:243 stop:1115 length:873 start_codon:yes stop_codon:yes gene_type:complete
MGLGLATIQNMLELWQQGHLDNTKSVMEMGSQELHVKLADFEQLLNTACITNYDTSPFHILENWPGQPRCSAKPFYKLLGINKYSSIDINNEHGSISHDYNLPLKDTTLYNQFDLVTDHGSCEHAFNIAEAYQTIHKLCKPGGLIIISQTLWGGNGYFLYDKKFFESIAAANQYSILYTSYVISPGTQTMNGTNHQFHIPLHSKLLSAIDKSTIDGVSVYAVMKKHQDKSFRIPYQGDYMSIKHQHYGFNRMYIKDPPSYSYIPTYNLKKVPGRVLINEIYKRIKNKFFK